VTTVELVAAAARAAADKKARDVVVLDVTELLGITDYFLICSGTSERQVRTISEEIVKQLKQHACPPLRREGEREGRWTLLDYEDFVVHVFQQDDREYYDLERLWKDAPRVLIPGLVSGREAAG
jgi:ribosome-associated protein